MGVQVGESFPEASRAQAGAVKKKLEEAERVLIWGTPKRTTSSGGLKNGPEA